MEIAALILAVLGFLIACAALWRTLSQREDIVELQEDTEALSKMYDNWMRKPVGYD